MEIRRVLSGNSLSSEKEENTRISCYNMVPMPGNFNSIGEMINYLPTISAMGYTHVWLNPITEETQMGSWSDITNFKANTRTDKITHRYIDFINSIYAAKYFDTLNSGISEVKNDNEGNYIFTSEQQNTLQAMSNKELKRKFGIADRQALKKLFAKKNHNLPKIHKKFLDRKQQLIDDIAHLKNTLQPLREALQVYGEAKKVADPLIKTVDSKLKENPQIKVSSLELAKTDAFNQIKSLLTIQGLFQQAAREEFYKMLEEERFASKEVLADFKNLNVSTQHILTLVRPEIVANVIYEDVKEVCDEFSKITKNKDKKGLAKKQSDAIALRLKEYSLQDLTYFVTKATVEFKILKPICDGLEATLQDKEKQLELLPFDCDKAIRKEQAKRIILKKYFDEIAIKEFTQKARQLNIEPIFDLVMNHVGIDSPLVAQYPHWFKDDNSFSDVKAFNYNDPTVVKEVFENVWKPLIDHYVQLGFTGVRVDCVRKLPIANGVRQKVYAYLQEQVKETHSVDATFLEELLFTASDLAKVVKEVGKAGDFQKLYVTGSMYYTSETDQFGAPRNPFGGTSRDIAHEMGLKASLGAVINFTGNHDHTPAAQEILIRMAKIRLETSTDQLSKYYKEMMGKVDKKIENIPNKFSKPEIIKLQIEGLIAKKEGILDLAIFPIIQDLKREMAVHPRGETATIFQMIMRNWFALQMFSGPGGYYSLGGDEFGNTVPPEIYLRGNHGEVYPQGSYDYWLQSDLGKLCLQKMALKKMEKKEYLLSVYDSFDIASKERLLMPDVYALIYAINANEKEAQQDFAAFMLSEGGVKVEFSEKYFITKPRSYNNNWHVDGEARFDFRPFIKEHNHILSKRQKPDPLAWSHSFNLFDEQSRHGQIVATICVNGEGFHGPIDIILTNLLPESEFLFDLNQLKNVASYFQKRCFPPEENKDYYFANKDKPEFSEAWNLFFKDDIKPNFYCASGITITKEARKCVNVVVEPDIKLTESILFEGDADWQLTGEDFTDMLSIAKSNSGVLDADEAIGDHFESDGKEEAETEEVAESTGEINSWLEEQRTLLRENSKSLLSSSSFFRNRSDSDSDEEESKKSGMEKYTESPNPKRKRDK